MNSAAAPASFLAVNSLHMVQVDRKSTRLNSSHGYISYAVFSLKKKTPFEDCAPGGCTHACEKPVRAFAAKVAWLIRPFHRGSSGVVQEYARYDVHRVHLTVPG